MVLRDGGESERVSVAPVHEKSDGAASAGTRCCVVACLPRTMPWLVLVAEERKRVVARARRNVCRAKEAELNTFVSSRTVH